MPRSAIVVICLLQLFCQINCEGYYTIIGPGSVRPNSEYHVAVSVHENAEPSTIKLGIISESYSNLKIVDVQPHSTQLVKLDVGDIKDDEYKLTAEGTSGIIFTNETRLNFIDKQHTVLFQTDKAIYKPGDLVRYRVIVIDSGTRPTKIGGETTVSVNDGKTNKIKNVKNIKFTKGVYTDELQLSSFPVLGKWTIEAELMGKTHTKEFEVAEYVLPKFEVTIDAPKYAAYKDRKIRATVRAKYTFGKPVVGEATISLYPKQCEFIEFQSTSKVVPLDGKARAEFDMAEVLNTENECEVRVEAVVEEKLTGRKHNATKMIKLRKDRYKIESLNAPNMFEPNVPFQVVLKVTNLDGLPVLDDKNPVKISIRAQTSQTRINETVYNIQPNGLVKFEWTFANHIYYKIQAEYLDTEITWTVSQKNGANIVESLNLEILTKKLILNYFVYQIIGRGDILLTNYIEVPDRNYYVFKFMASFSMIPNAKLMVYFVQDGQLIFKETTIEFEKDLSNFIKLNVPTQASPGQDVDIGVSTNPNSYIGLLGVDQSVLLLKDSSDLTKDGIFSELASYDSRTPKQNGDGIYPGESSGAVTLTNAHYPYTIRRMRWRHPHLFLRSSIGYYSSDVRASPVSPDVRVPPPQQTKIQTRKEFPETWIWEASESLNAEGQLTLHKKVPDTITSWIITGFSIDPITGLGLTKTQRKLQVFQPFFVSTDLPYSVKRGEVIAIPIIVFNYMDNDLDAEVTLDNTAQEFEFTEMTNEIVENPKIDLYRQKHLEVPSNTGKSVSFMIRPKRVGHITIKFTAVTPLAGDAVERTLIVEPEGVTEYVNRGVLVDLTNKTEFTQNITIDLPQNIVPDSTYVEVSVVGDLLGPTIKNLDKLIRIPCGCGEQNMVNFVPNILVLKYLQKIGQLTPAIETKAKKYMEIGYQRQLSYKHPDGSYSAFGISDKSGSTWLTAYTARSFQQASEYIEIDKRVITDALKFLVNNQAENGSFPEVGRIVDKIYASSTSNGVGLTAYTLLAFLENKELIPTYRNVINKALDYIARNLNDSDNIYTLAIVAYVLQLADHPTKDSLIPTLDTKATTDADRKWWNLPVSENEEGNPMHRRPRSVNVEMTSYGLLAFLEAGLVTESLPILKWLIAQRNSNGGFESTQDTVIGLQALIKFAETLSSKDTNVQIVFGYGDGAETRMNVNEDNAIILQSYELPANVKYVTITGSGRGTALVQVSFKYNVNITGAWPRFTLAPQVDGISHSDYLRLSICTSFIPTPGGANESNMAVMEVSMPSGFTVDLDTLPSLEATESVKRVETKNGDTVVVVYFDSLDANEICPIVDGYKTHKVANQKPAPVIVYDYYDNAHQARMFYTPTATTLCDICEGSDCAASCSPRAE